MPWTGDLGEAYQIRSDGPEGGLMQTTIAGNRFIAEPHSKGAMRFAITGTGLSAAKSQLQRLLTSGANEEPGLGADRPRRVPRQITVSIWILRTGVDRAATTI